MEVLRQAADSNQWFGERPCEDCMRVSECGRVVFSGPLANELSKDDAFSRGLPKWPQLKLTGVPVTEAQAKDIIARTDSFITSISSWCGGNNRAWNDWALNALGFSELLVFSTRFIGSENLIKGFAPAYYEILDEVRKELGFVQTQYVGNHWLSSAFIYGPYGWCSPQGTLAFVDNVGKWPNVEDIFNDLELIAEAFPYVTLTATLMNGEGSEDETFPIITFVVKDGKVVMTDEHNGHHYPVEEPDRSDAAMMRRFEFDLSEQGVPDAWVREFGNKFKPAVNKALKALTELVQKG